jgi:hypothetical protein
MREMGLLRIDAIGIDSAGIARLVTRRHGLDRRDWRGAEVLRIGETTSGALPIFMTPS